MKDTFKEKILDFFGLKPKCPEELYLLDKYNLKMGKPYAAIMIILNTLRLIFVFLNESFSPCHLGEALFSSILLYVVDILFFFVDSFFAQKKVGSIYAEVFLNCFLFSHVFTGFQVGIDSYEVLQLFIPFNIGVFFIFLLLNIRPLVSLVYSFAIYLCLHFFRGSLSLSNELYFFEGIYILAIAIVSSLRYFSGRKMIRTQIKNEEINNRLQELAKRDSLTGLYNRHALTMDVKDIYDKGLTLIMFDIDDFKNVNDTYGHEVGDELIKEFAHALKENFPDDKVYRYGGDEFLILRSSKKKEPISQKTMDKINSIKLFPMDDKISASCGYIYGTPKNYQDYLDLLKKADDCLYGEKRKRKFSVS